MKRSKQSLSHYKLLTCTMGRIVPLTWFETLPGDSIQHATSLLLRVSPLLSPVMHPVRVRIHHWFVPNRLLWEDWEDFITGGPDGMDASEHPYKTVTTVNEGGLHDYLGVPTGSYSPGLKVSALPYRAYQLIYNTHYRDQDLITEENLGVASGSDTTTSTSMNNCAWEKDYFTCARPWEQKGEQVNIPLLGEAPVLGLGKQNSIYLNTNQAVYESGANTATYANAQNIGDASVNNYMYAEEDPDNSGYPNIRADLSSAGSISVNDLRFSLAVQRYQEARANYGSRYVEYLRYLGIRNPSDARLQNPEFLGGGRQVIQFSEVLQSVDDASGYNLGHMGGHGISAIRTNKYRRFFEEHGIVMTLLSVAPKTIYMDGIDRKFNRLTKEDYFQKELQYLGDQRVLNREVYGFHSDPEETFGYQQRYDEYRYSKSNVSGHFRSTLNHWHYARDFASDPALNETFVTCNPTSRVYASTSTHPLYIMGSHSIQARRPMAQNPTPRTF